MLCWHQYYTQPIIGYSTGQVIIYCKGMQNSYRPIENQN